MPQAYFPSLDKCLSGEERLLSWKTVHQTLCDPARAIEETALEIFLTDDESIARLVRSLEPSQPPSSKSKSDYETKTAPINVSQTTGPEYDLEELKKDTQWLSEKLKIEELEALRVVILEWQSKAEDLLRKAPASRSDSGIPNPSSALSRSFASPNGAGMIVTGASGEQARRDRQLAIYLEEKSYVLQTNAGLMEHSNDEKSDPKLGNTWLDRLAARVSEAQYSGKNAAARDAYCAQCIDLVGDLTKQLDHASNWPEPFTIDEDESRLGTHLLYAAATTQDIISVLRILLATIFNLKTLASPALLKSWFGFMSRVGFFKELVIPVQVATTLQCLVSIISLAILQLKEVLIFVQKLFSPESGGALYPHLPDGSYIRDDACVKAINMALYQAAEQDIFVAAPAIYAWSIITSLLRDGAKLQQEMREALQIDEGSEDGETRARRTSRRDSKDDFGVLENLYYLLQNPNLEAEARDDLPAFLARIAVDRMGVYAIISQLCTSLVEIYGSPWDQVVSHTGRVALMDLIREGMSMVTYGAPVLESILTILRPNVQGRSTSSDSELAGSILDGVFEPAIVEQALSRYPYELTPVLRLFTALSSASNVPAVEGMPVILKLLDSLSTMTVMVPDHFRSYVLEHEDENVNSMRLTGPLPLFLSRTTSSLYSTSSIGRGAHAGQLQATDGKNLLSIPSSTAGIFLRETRPYVFCLEHTHSGLGYLGLLLSTLLPNADVLVPPTYTDLDRATAAEIVSLITALITVCTDQDGGVQAAQYVLDRFSLGLSDERDIVSIVADTMEVELLAHLEQSIFEGSLDMLVACVEFFDKLILVAPERVWPTLMGSSLLGLNGGANALAMVVGGVEVSTGRFRFLAACVRLYSHLITDAITGLVKRKTKPAKSSNRFDLSIPFTDATPERTMSTVLSAYQTVMLDVWQSLPEWRFAVPVELSKITNMLAKSFSKLLRSAHGISSGPAGITSLLIPASSRLLDACVSQTANGAMVQPFSMILQASVAVADERISSIERFALKEQATSTLDFLTALIRTVRTIDESESRASIFVSQLLSSMPTFACFLVADHTFKPHLYALLSEMVQTAQESTNSPISLLAQFDDTTAKSFLAVISHLDRPLCEIEVEATIWNMLSAVMSSKQQWFALFLLTGTLPKDKRKDDKGKDGTSKTKSLLAYALEQLSHIATLAPERAIAMLKFVSNAQNTWVWATNEVRSHSDFFKNALEWLNGLRLPTRAANIAEELLSANEHQMAASLCNILAVNLHAGNEVGDTTLIKALPSKLSFLTQNGVAVNAYKRSLHLNLGENFARKFPACEIVDFKRTLANPAPFGRKYYYDLDLADEVLGHETAWHGSLNGRTQGFSDEFARANVNLSLVEAQTRLLKSWQVLSTTLSECAGQDEALQRELANVVVACLRANAEADLEQPGMDRVMSIRAEMAFIILSELVSIKSAVPAVKKIFPAAWDLVRTSPMNYDVATSLEDVFYYRKLLQVLYLAMQPYVYMQSKPSAVEPKATEETSVNFLDPAVAAYVVQMMMKLIAPGFRALCSNLHNSTRFAEPGDFALVTALLQAALSIPGVLAVHQQLADIVSNAGIVRGALSLYSWSDQLAESMQQDPIYGEVAITFLLSLSAIAQVAEQMALDGVLIQLSSANLSNYFRKIGGKSPFSEPRRMFAIWTEGFLPLCLNLLDAVGPPLAAEVSAFLNSFSEQLQRASTALENREATRQNPYARAVTLSLVSEAHCLCLIACILKSDIARGAAEGIDAGDVPELQYDHRKIREDAEGLMRQKESLASRIVPLGEREEVWMAGGSGLPSDNLLFNKVVNEIQGLLKCSAHDVDGS